MRICCVLSCDARFFQQTWNCILTIMAARPALKDVELDIAVVAIDLTAGHVDLLKACAIIVHEKIDDFPLFVGAPRHAYALTCRPFIPEFLPGYDGYMWIDSDIRFLNTSGLEFYVNTLRQSSASVIIVQETEPSYSVHTSAKVARLYHSAFAQRLAAVYGNDVAEYCRYFTQFNAGLFAAPGKSPIWARYRRNLHKALRVAFDNMLEQDALNVSIQEVGGCLRAPSSMNWLCSLALPVKRNDGTWCNPGNPLEPIYVAHLTNSQTPVVSAAGTVTWYDLYRDMGLTA
jgi:hypothetical protein